MLITLFLYRPFLYLRTFHTRRAAMGTSIIWPLLANAKDKAVELRAD